MIFFDRSSPSSAICARTRIVAAISISRSSLTPLQYCNDANDQRRCEVKPRLPQYGSKQHRSRHGCTGLPRQRSALGIYEINFLQVRTQKNWADIVAPAQAFSCCQNRRRRLSPSKGLHLLQPLLLR